MKKITHLNFKQDCRNLQLQMNFSVLTNCPVDNKIILFCYSERIYSTRDIEKSCKFAHRMENGKRKKSYEC